jgi:homoserine O-acetyltransferase/O-succinyltransferase
MRYIILIALLAATLVTTAFAQTPITNTINMGVCKLESGAEIQDCKIAYTTIGTLNQDRSNAILFPTWYGGKSGDILKYLAPGLLVDPSQFFVIVVDSFGNGVSSSPSNSVTQAGAAFPAVTLRDMVRMQKRLLNEHFKLDKLHAVMGISMGAMQALEWSAREPDIAKKFVAIAGSPRLAPYDIVFWETTERLLQTLIDCKCQRPMAVISGMRFLLQGVDYQASNAPYEMLTKIRDDIQKSNMPEALAYDRILQMRAMITHDVSKDFGGDLSAAAKRAGNKLLVLAGNKDNVVTPQPVLAYAKLGGAEALEFPNCGHDIPRCAANLINPAVRDFLSR